MATYTVTTEQLTAIADAINVKINSGKPLSFPDEFISAIESIQTGGSGSVNTLTLYSTNTSSGFTDTVYIDDTKTTTLLESYGYSMRSCLNALYTYDRIVIIGTYEDCHYNVCGIESDLVEDEINLIVAATNGVKTVSVY